MYDFLLPFSLSLSKPIPYLQTEERASTGSARTRGDLHLIERGHA